MVNHRILEIPLLYTASATLYLNQVSFRKALASADSIITEFKNAIKSTNYHLDVRFKEGENIRNLIHERASLIDCILGATLRILAIDR